ncbi:MAG TPA: patatin-like phospholipase family protein [Rhizomicrobium sp.]|jgi:NTE family protein|nr:patatin-like phospholipase family protein [Rhizomicrobium sp.]
MDAITPRTGEFARRVLVLQGGGALGSYQGGVYEGLAEADFRPDWIAGISIGAINAAIIAGNKPEDRLPRLREFWETTSAVVPYSMEMPDSLTRTYMSGAAAAWVASVGVDGFFKPRFPPAYAYPAGAPEALSYYDTMPLRDTLTKLVDFDRINGREVRLSLGATNIRSGELIYFDNETHRIGPEHVMASGALPPGFPPIEIDGEHYWDGGVVSNTPLQYVLTTDSKDDLVIFQVDLFNARGPLPRNLLEVAEREKDIRYASRSAHSTEQALKIHEAKVALRQLLASLPPELRGTPNVELLGDISYENAVTVVKLIYRRRPFEGPSKDYEFSRQTMHDHWKAGLADLRKAMEKRSDMTCERHRVLTKTIEPEPAT